MSISNSESSSTTSAVNGRLQPETREFSALHNLTQAGDGIDATNFAIGASITDSGVAQLRDLPLTQLGIQQCAVTDASITHLVTLTKLRLLSITDTEISDKGVASLHEALPQCQIHWDGGVIEPQTAGEDKSLPPTT